MVLGELLFSIGIQNVFTLLVFGTRTSVHFLNTGFWVFFSSFFS